MAVGAGVRDAHLDFWNWMTNTNQQQQSQVQSKPGDEDGPEGPPGQPGQPGAGKSDGNLTRPNIHEDEVLKARRNMRKIARQIITAMSRHRKESKKMAMINFRKTINNAKSTGGIPIQISWKVKKIHKPRLLVLLDTSGSMDRHAKTLTLICQAVGQEISKFELFIFSNKLEYVTKDIRTDWRETLTNLERRQQWGGGTDLPKALKKLLKDYHNKLSPQTVVFIMSDLDTRGSEEAPGLVEEVRRKSKSLYIFNPDEYEYKHYENAYEGKATKMFLTPTLEDMANAVKQACLK